MTWRSRGCASECFRVGPYPRDDYPAFTMPVTRLPPGLLRFLPAALFLVLAGSFAVTSAAAATGKSSAPLQRLVDQAVPQALTRFQATHLQADQLALTLVDLRDPAHPVTASARGDAATYPASVIKLFYLAAAHRWLEDGRLADTPELRRALRDMIVDSSNDATHYVIDLLTGTTSGPELPEDELATWFDKRNAVTRYFASLGYEGVLAHKKPWGDGPYGRETQAMRLFEPKRNMLTTDATARLLVEIATGKCVTPARSAEMLTLLARDPRATDGESDNQAAFTGPALPAGARLWSKAGWTSQTRHDAALVELPNGVKFVLVVFTTNHTGEKEIIRSIARTIVEDFTRDTTPGNLPTPAETDPRPRRP